MRLFRLIDWLVQLPEEREDEFLTILDQDEEDATVAHITTPGLLGGGAAFSVAANRADWKDSSSDWEQFSAVSLARSQHSPCLMSLRRTNLLRSSSACCRRCRK